MKNKSLMILSHPLLSLSLFSCSAIVSSEGTWECSDIYFKTFDLYIDSFKVIVKEEIDLGYGLTYHSDTNKKDTYYTMCIFKDDVNVLTEEYNPECTLDWPTYYFSRSEETYSYNASITKKNRNLSLILRISENNLSERLDTTLKKVS